MGRVRAGTALLILLALSGCAADPPSGGPAPAEPTAAAPGAPSPPDATRSPAAEPTSTHPAEPEEQRCDHPTEGYSIAFPDGWFVVAAEGIEPCAFFHPEPLTLEPNSEATGVAVRAEVRDVPFDQARQDAQAEGEQTAQERTVAERAAVRLDGVLTEEVLLPAGTRTTTWLVELDAGTLLLTTDDAGDDDYDVAVQVLDEMAASLEIP
jgi:hypothetical protein